MQPGGLCKELWAGGSSPRRWGRDWLSIIGGRPATIHQVSLLDRGGLVMTVSQSMYTTPGPDLFFQRFRCAAGTLSSRQMSASFSVEEEIVHCPTPEYVANAEARLQSAISALNHFETVTSSATTVVRKYSVQSANPLSTPTRGMSQSERR